jgi:hypothetical protein
MKMEFDTRAGMPQALPRNLGAAAFAPFPAES